MAQSDWLLTGQDFPVLVARGNSLSGGAFWKQNDAKLSVLQFNEVQCNNLVHSCISFELNSKSTYCMPYNKKHTDFFFTVRAVEENIKPNWGLAVLIER
jgi:hypothetical protein